MLFLDWFADYEDKNQFARLCLFNHLAAGVVCSFFLVSVFCSQIVPISVRTFLPNKMLWVLAEDGLGNGAASTLNWFVNPKENASRTAGGNKLSRECPRNLPARGTSSRLLLTSAISGRQFLWRISSSGAAAERSEASPL